MTETKPSLQDFKRLARTYNVIPVFKEIVVDRVTPVTVYEQLHREEPYSFLLESVEGGDRLGRYSFVGQRPEATFVSKGRQVIYRQGGTKRSWSTSNPLQELKTIFDRFRPAPSSHLPRFWGGAVGYWSYDTVRFFERLPDGKPDILGAPNGAFQLSGELVIFDRFRQTATVMANVLIPQGRTSDRQLTQLYQQAVRSIERQAARIHERRTHETPKKRVVSPVPLKALTRRADYLSGVRRAKEHIRAGDIIQVVLSQRWQLKPKATPFQIYRALRLVNPSPYMYCLHFEDLDIVGSSPELLVRREGTVVETRPIAGTRRRGQTPDEDLALEDELKKDIKERAEHLMLVDLGRNDLGRVCKSGSVRVPDFMTVERYSHVMHLVSSVTGTLRPGANAFDLFQACFPAGTVAGAPKIRAMQIIDELESLRRGPYAGAVGYFSYTGNMDMAITIRTLVMKNGVAYLQAGAGIVADSVPEKEFKECEHKAAALRAAIERAETLS
jgi:anthranilate synthase component 1